MTVHSRNSASAGAGRREIENRSVRWDPSRAEEAYARGLWVRETLAEALDRAALSTPDRVLIVDGAVELTAADLRSRAVILAGRLLERAPRGAVVSFMLPNWHEAALIYLATTLAGMVAHPILPSLRDRELKFMLDDVDSRLIFVPADLRGHDYVAMMDRVVADLPSPPEVVVLRGDAGRHTAFEALETGDIAPLPMLEPDAVRMILYTSGTTGMPKGVMHTHNSIHALVRQLQAHWLIEPGDVFLVPSPISHIGGSIYAFEIPLLLGTTAVLMERWEAEPGLTLMRRHGCTHMAGATPFLEQLLAAARAADDHLPDLKVFICGGAAVPPSLIRAAADWFDKARVTRVYGSTEVPVSTVGVLEAGAVDLAAETDGRPGVAEVRLVDADEAIAATGEVRARGPQMLVGYLHPEDEATVFDADGFYRTGDLGRWDDGCLVISGRAKDIIIRKGENIAPKEIEDILVTHPRIAEIAVVGLPDVTTGERACAVIVPRDGEAPNVIELGAFLREAGLAAFKIPEQVAVLDALPKNDAGKVLKHVLRADLTRGAA
ncbi:MAG: cyclohexanecarboxylate-CoA ligase [Caulobacteraceae bacterium]|nr:cyclohexanecarboxylate-CoA ligase [Caulobacteraceae bacterium]